MEKGVIMIRLLYRFVVAVVLSGLLGSSASGHNLYLPVIVDTDMGSDDARAIIMLLNAGSVDVRLMVTSDGVLAPDTGQDVLSRVLTALNRPDIPTARGERLSMPVPPFRGMNEELAWPGIPPLAGPPPQEPGAAARAVVHAVQSSQADLLYLCLGPLTNLALALETNPEIQSRIHAVVYLGGEPRSANPGWNSQRDMDAAAAVYGSGIKVIGLGLPEPEYPVFDRSLMTGISGMGTEPARLITGIHSTPAMQQTISDGHMKVWDELTVIYLNSPGLFELVSCENHPSSQRLAGFDRDGVLAAYLKLLGNPSDFHLDERYSVVLNAFPTDPGLMRPDVSGRASAIIQRHGLEEWKACLLTNELHRHLGIYSLVGAKMGIRAREILNAPFDSLEVVSMAGLKPPLSCMNDGLQVATGASLGRGTIQVLDGATGPTARFRHNGTVFELTLKPEYVQRIRSDIARAVERFNGIGPEYFAHIRQLSIDYWYEFDRNTLFDEQLRR